MICVGVSFLAGVVATLAAGVWAFQSPWVLRTFFNGGAPTPPPRNWED